MRKYTTMARVCLFFLAPIALTAASCKNKPEPAQPEKMTSAPPDTNTSVRPDININTYAPVDLSPMDMSYYPPDYPKMKMSKSFNGQPKARVIYSRPHLQGRHIFHEVLKYGEPWRLGANEATELQFFSDVTIEGQKIKAGRYIIYCIPQQKEWTVVLNTNTDAWGLQPDTTKDLARFTVPVKETGNSLEYFTMVFEDSPAGTNLLMAWDNAEIRLPIRF